MSESNQSDLRTTLQQMVAELVELRDRVADLEKLAAGAPSFSANTTSSESTADGLRQQAKPIVDKGITQGEILAISAAIAAWLGVQAHIRQIRLVRTGAWAQQGRVTIQASHRLNY